MSTLSEAKRSLRSAVRAARASVPSEARADAAVALATRLLDLPEVASARGVLAFASMPEEIDLAPAVEALRRRGARVAYPRVCGPADLTLHWAEPHELAPGHCGILEPGVDADAADPADIDVVLVPGVAFDTACRRLGMGAGFYDRLLAGALAHATRVAVAFDEQVVGEVPCEEHDARVDVLVTPSRTVRAPR